LFGYGWRFLRFTPYPDPVSLSTKTAVSAHNSERHEGCSERVRGRLGRPSPEPAGEESEERPRVAVSRLGHCSPQVCEQIQTAVPALLTGKPCARGGERGCPRRPHDSESANEERAERGEARGSREPERPPREYPESHRVRFVDTDSVSPTTYGRGGRCILKGHYG